MTRFLWLDQINRPFDAIPQSRDRSLGHVWTAPFLQVEKVSFGAVGCSHVSGLDVRRTYGRGP